MVDCTFECCVTFWENFWASIWKHCSSQFATRTFFDDFLATPWAGQNTSAEPQYQVVSGPKTRTIVVAIVRTIPFPAGSQKFGQFLSCCQNCIDVTYCLASSSFLLGWRGQLRKSLKSSLSADGFYLRCITFRRTETAEYTRKSSEYREYYVQCEILHPDRNPG